MKHYSCDQNHADFPLGGIGTGTISLKASGKLTDFQIYNRPSLGMIVPYTFFAMYSRCGEHVDARMLEAESAPDFYKARGYHPSTTMGMPKFPTSDMTVRYPFASIGFTDDGLPFRVSLTAYTPFIPSCSDDSGIPGIVFHYDVENISGEEAEVLIAASMANIHTLRGADSFDNYLQSSSCTNHVKRENDISGVFMTGDERSEDELLYGNNAIIAPDRQAEVREYWFRGGWYDSLTDFWEHFSQGVLAMPAENRGMLGSIGRTSTVVGSVGLRRKIPIGGKARFTFVMSWYVPNRVKGWSYEQAEGRTMKNYYAGLYENAWQAGCDLIRRMDTLEDGSRRFADALYASTLPEAMLDAIASNIAVLRSNTCWRAPDGTFMGWEGCNEQEGSCHGTCTHVWNYAQTVASLFPDLEKSSRLNEFLVETNEDGKMTFRNQRKFGLPDWKYYPAIDGQFGTIMRAWREWELGGDRAFLETVYLHVLRAFHYAMREWDRDGDGVPEERQHNTYDIEFYGANPLSAVMELGAIRAVINMAKEMSDFARVEELTALFNKARKRFIELCWQGEYYRQKSDDIDHYPYQFGEGCLTDQLLGQTMAYLCGLSTLLPEDQLDSAINAVFKYNFLSGDERGACTQRLFVGKDEDGLVLCSWPTGGKPRFPFPYSDEVWTGVEYQVSTLLIYRGMEAEALKIVEAARKRYDGVRRNPWAETECGFYYARAMASWGLLIAMSGFSCNIAHGEYTFAPRRQEGNFFWSVKDAWGTFSFDKSGCTIQPKFGNLKVRKLTIPQTDTVCSVQHNENVLDFTLQAGAILLTPLTVAADDTLRVIYS